MSRVTVRDDGVELREPFLVRPFEAGVTGWLVVFGAILAELVGGAVTFSRFTSAAVPVLIVPAVVAAGFGLVQWWLVWRAGADRASWWHLGAVAGALIVWFMWPVAPGPLDGSTGSAQQLCNALPTDNTANCLSQAAPALAASRLSWWLALGLILACGLLVRRSRIAVWASLPIALAGCQLSSHFLQQLYLHFAAVP
jgi:hypothetical protein